ncbi:MAG: PD-(D/E)XK nuclease family protein [Treponema sp.]|nr:PD-(D/E)XK nuclease family protein [Treponema sp.]
MNLVETILLENIDKPSAFFVLPTDIAVSRWIDRVLVLRGYGTIAREKFIAWDKFKQNSIRSKVQNRQSIPSVLRKMFVSMLIRENAELCAEKGEPVFSALIRVKWAQQADSFADWLTGILPHLALWFRQTTGLPIDQIQNTPASLTEGEDRDLFTLALRYTQFLAKHELFEPAWETPPFDDTGKECFIFFSESLLDFDEYRELLEASEHVKIVRTYTPGDEAEQQNHDVFFYTNSRSEITEAALYILALHNDQNIPWDSISVSVPETEAYGPYLFREFENRNIPYIRQTGKPLASYPAGQFFKAIADCASSDFSFSSMTALLLNRRLPWKDDQEIQDLIDFGIKNNCITSWTEEKKGKRINVWENAFLHPFGGLRPQTRFFFEDLKRRVNAMRHAKSFAEIRKNYFIFRERFFDMENCLEETDLVLSRCISELVYLTEIERSYPDVSLPDPYTFFTEYLDEVAYLAQQSASGVAILPYRTAAPAPFDCHIILGASQNNLQTVFSPLAFLSGSRRKKLGISDNDASLAFIKLHQFNSRLSAAFFCSEQTFSGYAIPHNALNAALKPMQRFGETLEHKAKFATDLYLAENTFYSSLHFHIPHGGKLDVPHATAIHANQDQGFKAWICRRENTPVSNTTLNSEHPLSMLIHKRFCKNGKPLSVSPSSLGPYFQCPLKWVFARVLQLEELEIEAGLMADNITGLVYHAILNLFLDELIKMGEVISLPVNSGNDKKPKPELPVSYRRLLAKKIETVFESFPRLPNSDKTEMSMLTARLLRAGKQLFYVRLEKFLAEFISFFAGYRVIASEPRYSIENDFYSLNGIVDCILEDARKDSSANGSLTIVDFKASVIPKLADCFTVEGLSDFQIPAYLRLAESALKKDVHTTLFFSIGDAKTQVWFGVIQNVLNDGSIPKKAEDRIIHTGDVFATIMNDFDGKAERFAKEVSGGTFSFSPPSSGRCQGCKYNKVCRVLYKIK